MRTTPLFGESVMSFEIADQIARGKIRFSTSQGLLTYEDLFEKPLTSANKVSLDGIAKDIFKQLKESEEVSFVSPTTSANSELQLKLELVKHVISIKMAENAAAATARQNAARRQQLAELKERKENDNLANLSVEELQAMIDALA